MMSVPRRQTAKTAKRPLLLLRDPFPEQRDPWGMKQLTGRELLPGRSCCSETRVRGQGSVHRPLQQHEME